MKILTLRSDSPDHYFQEVARLHETELQAGLLAKLGSAFLVDFYRFVARDHGCVLLAAIENEKVIGFVSGTYDIGAFYRRLAVRRGFKLAIHLIPYLLGRRSLSPVASLSRYVTSRTASQLPVSELTSLAVAPSTQRKGVGRALFVALEGDFRSRGIQAFQVTAAKTQLAALRFYPALGAKLMAQIRLGDLESSIFVCATTAVEGTLSEGARIA